MLTLKIDDLEGTEVVILRIDVQISCQFEGEPTGNLQAALLSATVTAPAAGLCSGAQTVPFKSTPDLVSFSRLIVDKVTDPSGTSWTCSISA